MTNTKDRQIMSDQKQALMIRYSFCQLADLFILHLRLRCSCLNEKTQKTEHLLFQPRLNFPPRAKYFKMLIMRAAGAFVSETSVHRAINKQVDCVVRRGMNFLIFCKFKNSSKSFILS